MKYKIYLLLFYTVIFISCSNKKNSTTQEYTYATFKNNLKADMNYSSIIAKFGAPSKDIGSGIHIYVYKLADDSAIWIGYTDKIIYANHLDKNHQLIENIL
ncbi:hypothetical protein [Flavobacterium phycosphaerae]|uniref:hypothetical protein n=1 Tax=Flavobacterium phycosphaerae TaxID=2697515 RepID=UPI001389F6D4|nr:hypothetical protein [Flavobacterium phycosphaerae]